MKTTPRRASGPFPWRVHPIWRGVGCLLMFIVPVIAFGLAESLVAYALAENPRVFNNLDVDLRGPEDLYLKIAITVVLTVLLYLIFSIVSSLMYSLAGGHRDEELADLTKPRPFRR